MYKLNEREKYKKRICLILSMYMTIVGACTIHTNSSVIKSNNGDKGELTTLEVYSSYNGSNIYIGNQTSIDYIFDASSNNIYVVDDRDGKNPDMQIRNSYKIKDEQQMRDILNILLEYEKENPSKWDRNLESMVLEWQVHNMCSTFGIQLSSTQSVDLDNLDADFYNKLLILKKK